MKKILLAVLAVMALHGVAKAEDAVAPHEDVIVKVNGMVCDFCAQSVWKVLKEYGAVDDVSVDLDTGEVTVHLKPEQDLTQEELDKAITYAGYDLVSITRAHHG